LRAQVIAFFGIQFLLRAFLQMRRLRLDEQFINLQAPVFLETRPSPCRV